MAIIGQGKLAKLLFFGVAFLLHLDLRVELVRACELLHLLSLSLLLLLLQFLVGHIDWLILLL